jgi:hypothetical protein
MLWAVMGFYLAAYWGGDDLPVSNGLNKILHQIFLLNFWNCLVVLSITIVFFLSKLYSFGIFLLLTLIAYAFFLRSIGDSI